MRAALTHRGPDGAGEFVGTHVQLGARRLSIIDLDSSWQPLFNEDRSLALVVNGEIYNYLELRAQLQQRGHRFNTAGDGETILHLYEECGLDCVQHLRGMFAFALWDNQRQRLLLARDRMGEKPLYLYQSGQQLFFASELKALLQTGQIRFELDAQAVNLFFHYHYVPEPLTPLRGVRKLPAGHLLTVETANWRVEEKCYWRMEDAPAVSGEPGALIRAELETISKLVVRADVPVGVALSGGLDSSAIAALATRQYPGTMQAFSVGYAGQPRQDERPLARAFAAHLGIPCHEIEVSSADVVGFFPQLVYWQDDPISDIAGYGYYAVMKAARAHGVPVMLQGQGGDELFWGYPWARRAVQQSLRKAAWQPHGQPALLDYLRFEAPESWTRMGWFRWALAGAGLRSSLAQFQRDRRSDPAQLVFYDLLLDFTTAQHAAPAFYAREFAAQLNGARATDLFTLPQPWPPLDVALTRLQCQTYLLENGVAQGDRLSMASSVELRLPLLDYRLVELVIGLRKGAADFRLPPKAWLKAALQDIVPDWVMQRPKRGFNPPVRQWHQALFAAYGATLADGYLVQAGVLDPAWARRWAAGPFPLGVSVPLSFKALVLETWCRNLANSAKS